MMTPNQYLAEIKSRLATSSIVESIAILEEYAQENQGYFRARLTLSNHDFLEISEYFIMEHGACRPRRYRYQWMDESQTRLKKRWDNVPHFPKLPNFPHHVHIGEESCVQSGESLSILNVIQQIETEINSSQ